MVNYCWNYGLSKLLLHFIEYCLDQRKKKHAKIAVNLTVQYFEGSCRKKYLLKVWIFGLPATKWEPCKVFAKLNGNHLLIANIFKLLEYQTFGLMKLHNVKKSDLPISNSVCEKVWFMINGPSKTLLFNFDLLFPNFKWLLSKIL